MVRKLIKKIIFLSYPIYSAGKSLESVLKHVLKENIAQIVPNKGPNTYGVLEVSANSIKIPIRDTFTPECFGVLIAAANDKASVEDLEMVSIRNPAVHHEFKEYIENPGKINNAKERSELNEQWFYHNYDKFKIDRCIKVNPKNLQAFDCSGDQPKLASNIRVSDQELIATGKHLQIKKVYAEGRNPLLPNSFIPLDQLSSNDLLKIIPDNHYQESLKKIIAKAKKNSIEIRFGYLDHNKSLYANCHKNKSSVLKEPDCLVVSKNCSGKKSKTAIILDLFSISSINFEALNIHKTNLQMTLQFSYEVLIRDQKHQFLGYCDESVFNSWSGYAVNAMVQSSACNNIFFESQKLIIADYMPIRHIDDDEGLIIRDKILEVIKKFLKRWQKYNLSFLKDPDHNWTVGDINFEQCKEYKKMREGLYSILSANNRTIIPEIPSLLYLMTKDHRPSQKKDLEEEKKQS